MGEIALLMHMRPLFECLLFQDLPEERKNMEEEEHLMKVKMDDRLLKHQSQDREVLAYSYLFLIVWEYFCGWREEEDAQFECGTEWMQMDKKGRSKEGE